MSAIYEQNISYKKGSQYYKSVEDMNGDGIVNKTDIRLIYRAVSNGYQAGDVTRNGKVDYNDLNEMVAIIKEKHKYNYNGLTWDDVFNIADLNSDNNVDEEDYDILYRLALIVNGSKQILIGDVNQDGKITQADSTLIMNYLRKSRKLTTSQKKYADINGDGKISVTDAIYILNIAAGSY